MNEEEAKVYEQVKLFWSGIGVTIVYGLMLLGTIWLVLATFLAMPSHSNQGYDRYTTDYRSSIEQHRENASLNGIDPSDWEDYYETSDPTDPTRDDTVSGDEEDYSSDDAMNMETDNPLGDSGKHFSKTSPAVDDDMKVPAPNKGN